MPNVDNSRSISIESVKGSGVTFTEPLILPTILSTLKSADWSLDIGISSLFSTSVTENLEDSQERVSLQEYPYRSVIARLTGISKEENARIFEILVANADGRHPFPIYSDQSELTQVYNINDSELFIDTTNRRFYKNRRILVIDRTSTKTSIGTIFGIESNKLILTSPLSNEFKKQAYAVPLMDCEINLNNIKSNVTKDKVTLVITFNEVQGASTLPCADIDKFDGDSYKGLPVFRPTMNWAKPQSSSVVRRGNEATIGRASIITEEGNRGYFTFDLFATEFNRADAWYLIEFFESRKGRAFSFYAIAPDDLFNFVSGSANDIIVSGISEFVEIYNKYISTIYLEYEDGTNALYTVTGVFNIVGSTNSRIQIEETYVDPGSPVIKATYAVTAIFSLDGITEKWITEEICEIEARISEVIDEDDAIIDPTAGSLDIRVSQFYANVVTSTPVSPPVPIEVRVSQLYMNVVTSTAPPPSSAPVYQEPWAANLIEGTLTDIVDNGEPNYDSGDARNGHPYLYWTLTEAQTLANRIYETNGSYKSTHEADNYSRIKTWVDANPVTTHWTARVAYGLVYLIESQAPHTTQSTVNTTYGDPLISDLANGTDGANEPDWNSEAPIIDRGIAIRLTSNVIAWDCVYDYMRVQDPSNHQKMRDRIYEETKKYYLALSQPWNNVWDNWWAHTYSQNHFHRTIYMGMVMGAGVLKYEGDEITNGSQSEINTWINYMKIRARQDFHAHKNNLGGSWPEGRFYENVGLYADKGFGNPLFVRVFGFDVQAQGNIFKMNPVYQLYNKIPGDPFRPIIHDGDAGVTWNRTNTGFAHARMCATVFQDPAAQFLADQRWDELAAAGHLEEFFTGSNKGHLAGSQLFLDLYWYDHTLAPVSPPDTWPNSVHLKNSGMIICRNKPPGSTDPNHVMFGTRICSYPSDDLHALDSLVNEWTGVFWVNHNQYDPTNPVALEGSPPFALDYPQDHKPVIAHNHPDRSTHYLVKNQEYMAFDCGDKTNNSNWPGYSFWHNLLTLGEIGHIGQSKLPIQADNDLDYLTASLPFIDELPNLAPEITLFAPGQEMGDIIGADLSTCWSTTLGLTKEHKYFFFLKGDKKEYLMIIEDVDSTVSQNYRISFLSMGNPIRGTGGDTEWVKCPASSSKAIAFGMLKPNSGLSYAEDSRVHDDMNPGQAEGGHGEMYGNFSLTVNREFNKDEFYKAHLEAGSTPSGPRRIVAINYETANTGWETDLPDYVELADTSTHFTWEITHNQGAWDGGVDRFILNLNTDLTIAIASGGMTLLGKACIMRYGTGTSTLANLSSFLLANGGQIQLGGLTVVETLAPQTSRFESFECVYDGTEVRLCIKTFHAFKLYAPGITTLKIMGQVYGNWTKEIGTDYINVI